MQDVADYSNTLFLVMRSVGAPQSLRCLQEFPLGILQVRAWFLGEVGGLISELIALSRQL